MKPYGAIGLGCILFAWLCGWLSIWVFGVAGDVFGYAAFVSCTTGMVLSIVEGVKNKWWPLAVINLVFSVVTFGFFAFCTLLIWALESIH